MSSFKAWFHRTFDDWFFRSLIGPAQTKGAVHGADHFAREQWKRDLENRKRYTREQRERKRAEREARRSGVS
ncbi:hypothetical protein Ait01nite_031220 [Actinoplanes italicus]|uniref:Uncharacterized protein n=1 Tax=Actinoplanes italicus TaxID=113567 RepID=A0A2T0KJ78_9ACTN|nr:hypothetical protein [Actinoplanes italicus]PRX23577.1 hypothetical protein CLV67_103326 [Actinoplanes italicus]GIE30077.1 hypothetical protein Ait01nite_031220 [Actinoplanes italicus]